MALLQLFRSFPRSITRTMDRPCHVRLGHQRLYWRFLHRRSATTKSCISVQDLTQPRPVDDKPPLGKYLPGVSGLKSSTTGRRARVKHSVGTRRANVAVLDTIFARRKTKKAYPKVLQQIRELMDKFVNCVLLTRVGSFYELYFEQATKFAPMMNIKVAEKQTSAGPIAMAGFPHFYLDRFLKMLVNDHGCRVAIAEEFSDTASLCLEADGALHDRRVTRVVTPGTLIDENFIDPYASNFIMSIHARVDDSGGGYEDSFESTTPNDTVKIGLAWLDLSTGHFLLSECSLQNLPSVLARVGPREIVLEDKVQSRESHPVLSMISEHVSEFRPVVSYHHTDEAVGVDPAKWSPVFETPLPSSLLTSITCPEAHAGQLLLLYVEERLQSTLMKVQPPQRYQEVNVMALDKSALGSLEIKTTMKNGNFQGSLLHSIRRTVTKGGSRLLAELLSAPSTSLSIILKKQDIVAYFVKRQALRNAVSHHLKRCHDTQRLLQKFALCRGTPDDLLSLAVTINATKDLVIVLQDFANMEARSNTSAEDDDSAQDTNFLWPTLRMIRLCDCLALASQITKAIDCEGLERHHRRQLERDSALLAQIETALWDDSEQSESMTVSTSYFPAGTSAPGEADDLDMSNETFDGTDDIWIITPKTCPSLEKLHKKLAALNKDKMRLQFSRDESTPSNRRSSTPEHGRQVPFGQSTNEPQAHDWITIEEELIETCERIKEEEHRILEELRCMVARHMKTLRCNATVLDELDVALGFAIIAVEQNFVRPTITDTDDPGHKIIAGRHPTVEKSLTEQGKQFVSNDCILGAGAGQFNSRVWLITGPNMAGKSTFLRQNALITILAQAGSFVPATSAEIGIVDAIFSRMGSGDSIHQDQSTFMVEMLETAYILRRATSRSLVIIDEIGRGTCPNEGTALAFACLHHLATVNKCRALFSTHLHGVIDHVEKMKLDARHGGPIDMYCTGVSADRDTGKFTYVYRLRRGANRSSHAIKVAGLAGLPQSVLRMANSIVIQNSEEQSRESSGNRQAV